MAGQIDWGFEEIFPECNIPADLMVSILTRLPVKSLLKFKAVSKPWCCFISSPRFVNLHLRRQSLVANNNHLLLSSDDGIYGVLTHVHEKINTCIDNDVLILENPPLFESLRVEAPGENRNYIGLSSEGKRVSFPVINRYCVIGSCNGLVGVCSFQPPRHGGIILWNPATKQNRRIQLPDGDFGPSFRSLGLYYVEATSDFKIVGWAVSGSLNRRPSLFVYTLSCDSWKKWDWNCDDAEKSPILFGPSTLIGGCMHWLSSTSGSKSVITAFDVVDGAMSFFGVPDDSKTSRRTLAIRGCLSLAILRDFGDMESGLEVWVMEEYGVEESWVKRFTIREPILGLIPLTCWNEGEIVARSHKADLKILAFYDLFNNKKYFLEFKSIRVDKVFSYVESLASVGTEKKLQADLIQSCEELSI